ncbi:uncharacterized protein A4U43_C09F12810 [Asparagus officinalis]|uniref:DYW domain-containing protein n=1 Tax=Asparagus officinalis TaxID=4686 RepID=A0A5P1E701_ASPOF|nr:pentatricopeptide repeat-containing protein At4g33170 [Asparagus officinalis]XP_020246865.1 pentatricopeptide repeat-containing protein At4g33170 [Asparagus officinalis]ONK58442.1 uncharacterized protein A4U43_C09F12810 [Asparagus officinalis]
MPFPITISALSLPHLQRAHALLTTSGLISDLFFSNNLISSYSKCGSVSSARQLFDQILHRDSVTWNSLLSAFAHNNLFSDAFHHFRQMLISYVPPTKLTVIPLLKLCANTSHCVSTSRAVHSFVVKIGLESDAMVSSSLVGVYAKSGLLDEAKCLFDGMIDRDVVLWNVMIKGHAQLGFGKKSFLMFSELHRSGTLRPDAISVRCVLMGLETGREFEQVRSYGIKSCLLEDISDVITWNKRLSENVQDGKFDDVLNRFVEMKRKGVGVDNVTFVIVLSAVTNEECFELGKQIHVLAMKEGFHSDTPVSNNLINLYAKMNSLDAARTVFDRMKELDLVSWNSMISANVQSGLDIQSIDLFMDMTKNGFFPDHYTLTSILRACLGITASSSIHEQVHTICIKMGLLSDFFVLTALIDTYAEKGNMERARILFEGMDWFDHAACNALISGYIKNNDNSSALNLFASLHQSGGRSNDFSLATVLKACSGLVALQLGKQIHAYAVKLGFDSNVCVSSSILDMYIKCGNMLDSSAAFSDIHEPDDVAWTAMISGYVENGNEDYALNLFHQMRKLGLLPDEFTLASLVKACSCLAALGQGRQIHAIVIKLDHASDSFVGTSMMDMYAKCGNIEDSYELFKRMDFKNNVSWNVMVLGFAQHGKAGKALDLFNKMVSYGLQPDKITFLGVLSACSHSGLVSKAYNYFDSMFRDYGIKPEAEHYSSLVDALGRAGLLSKAEEVIDTMPFNASSSTYRALLGACRNQRNMELGEKIANKLLLQEPQDASAYVLMSNIYATSNKWDGVTNARRSMKCKNIRKDPGYSWIEVKNKMHMFVVDDKSHPENQIIYDELEDLIRRIKHEGYVPNTEVVLLDVEEEEKERSLYYHSEKLAIAYGLLRIPAPQKIRIIKNLRVCGDCHNAIKYMSKVSRREIVLRDGSRFHCFGDGKCSCGDYW